MIRVVSLFCGAGFADAALYKAAEAEGLEVEVVAAYDSWAEAVKVYNANLHPVAQVVDVKTLRREDLPPHDLVIGGPPCQDHSLAGLRKCKCNVGGAAAPRCCLADFVRLAGDGPYLMENVAPRLIPASFSVKLNAFNFGDVTTRKRWFYSNYLLHIIETPGPRRFRDIRDHEADRVAITKRQATVAPAPSGERSVCGDGDALGSFTGFSAVGGFQRVERKRGDTRGGRNDAGDKVSTYADADALTSLTAHAWHGHDVRSNVKLVGLPKIMTHRPRTNETGCEPYATYVDDDGAMGSLNAGGYVIDSLKVGLRGHSASASASAFEDDEPLGSLVSNSWHGNEFDKLGPGVRCPSILEMARAHSISDSFDWAGATKTNIGKMIANGIPLGMCTAVLRAMLRALR